MLKYASPSKISAKKITRNPLFQIVRLTSFKVIDVGSPGKLVSSVYCDKQQVCGYLDYSYHNFIASGMLIG